MNEIALTREFGEIVSHLSHPCISAALRSHGLSHGFLTAHGFSGGRHSGSQASRGSQMAVLGGMPG